MKKNIIILTKSIKHGGFCVAGIDTDNGEWIRLISSDANSEHAVPYQDMVCEDGNEVEVLDLVEVDIISACPSRVQPENYLYNENVKWKRIRTSNINEVIDIHGIDNPQYVFGNSDAKLTDDNIHLARRSLLLLEVENPMYFIKTFPNGKKVQLNFTYNGYMYRYLKVTQQDIYNYYMNQPDGIYNADTNLFVFSLTDKYELSGKYYKVMAQAL